MKEDINNQFVPHFPFIPAITFFGHVRFSLLRTIVPKGYGGRRERSLTREETMSVIIPFPIDAHLTSLLSLSRIKESIGARASCTHNVILTDKVTLSTLDGVLKNQLMLPSSRESLRQDSLTLCTCTSTNAPGFLKERERSYMRASL